MQYQYRELEGPAIVMGGGVLDDKNRGKKSKTTKSVSFYRRLPTFS